MIDEQAPTDAALLNRFVTETDADAFAALVERHGPMVWGVCRRLLPCAHDAEDAFQATFLVLVRRAGHLRRRELLANWLYGVARRVALRARAGAVRRRQREGQSADLAEAAAPAAPDGDLGPLVHEEVGRMPPRYRGPVVLCYLQGLSNEEAARELACPVGTVKSRLSRARELLRGRLERRGVTLSMCALTAALTAEAAGVPAALAATTAPAVLQFVVNPAAGGLISAQAATLTQGVLQAMLWTKMKLLGVALAACLVTAGAGWVALQGRESARTARTPAPPQEAKQKTDAELLSGKWKVVRIEADGKEGKAEDDGEAALMLKAKVEFTADRLILVTDGKNVEMEFKLDPKAKPKTIDMTIVKATDAPVGKMFQGIYSLEKDTLKLCINHDGMGPRPTELTTRAGSQTFLMVLRRGEEGK